MPLDHYVPQVHLKNFYSPNLEGRIYAIRKHDLKEFIPTSKSVCRIEEGSTNSYLNEPRVIEEFLKEVEPKYNDAVGKLVTGNIDRECIYVISGFVAYVLTCSPAGMRIRSQLYQATLNDVAKKLDSQGKIGHPPGILGANSLTELLDKGEVRIKVDPKYPQAIGISSILDIVKNFGNFKWDILVNTFNDSPFFTSDFPVANENTKGARVTNRIVPLTPYLAIRACPDPSLDRERFDFSFPFFQHTFRKISRSEVEKINRLIVRCAESTVFFRDQYAWVPSFVRNNSRFRVEIRTQTIPHTAGSTLFFQEEIVAV